MQDTILGWLYSLFVGQWLWTMFRYGPSSLGCWKGLADADVCARLSRNSEARDWMLPGSDNIPTAACTNMIQREFDAFAVVVHTVLYCGVVVATFTGLRHWCTTRAQARAFAQALADAMPGLALRERGCGPSFRGHDAMTATAWRPPETPS